MAKRGARPYHHGNLAEALVDTGLELASEGGPDAVVLREAARRLGVSATSAYRHFDGQSGLLEAIKVASMERLAEHMRAALADYEAHGGRRPGVPLPGIAPGSSQERALRRLEEIGRAYFDFALTQQGLFRCFCDGLPVPRPLDLTELAGAPTAEWSADEPAFGVLSEVLDELVEVGLLRPERRASGVDVALWAAVHGLAMLCLDGPLAAVGPDVQGHLLDAVLDVSLHGLLPR